jgi:hypothetical protein
MTANVGAVDRALRIIIGLGLIAAAATGYFTPWGYDVVPLGTGLVAGAPPTGSLASAPAR